MARKQRPKGDAEPTTSEKPTTSAEPTHPHQLVPGDLVTIAQAAKLVNNVHRVTILRWIQKGKLRGFLRAGTRWMVSRAEVLALIQPCDAGGGRAGNGAAGPTNQTPPPTR